MASNCAFSCIRHFSTSRIFYGKRNVRSFPLHNFRGTEAFQKKQKVDPDPEIPVYNYGVRRTGYNLNGKFHEVPEMIPDIIVPDLTDCKLQPYVSYKTVNVVQSEFTAKDLFDAVYSKKIQSDWESGKLNETGQPLEPSPNEALTADEARAKAQKTGSDIF